eukprot:CAMPEP_0194328818 /NCGR_PEP_ID=MMETSP0171-20130528/46122_1 /TAXON_ID=218684 /ORGANISM="Corethron pennatum, Strain L29A3" /LENGTH=47 /DNA_ID=CAMNT_0039089319 /DNA_START=83 /DNA_END=223 /DNA_ORIENTATION=+
MAACMGVSTVTAPSSGPSRIPTCTAAPSATASSGSTVLRGLTPVTAA